MWSHRLLRLGRLLVAACAALVGAIAFVGFVPLPLGLTRLLTLSTSDWILTDYVRAVKGPRTLLFNTFRKLVATYVQYNVVAGFRRTHEPQQELGDVERLAAFLVPLRRTMLSQVDVAHTPASWPTIVSGMGWCDQLNGMAANVLSRDFEHAQLVGLINTQNGVGHTIGRVWSNQRREWLYFDVWGAVVVFHLNDRHEPDVLKRWDSFPGSIPPDLAATTDSMYAFTAQGSVFNEYAPSFGGYLLAKVSSALHRRSLSAVEPSSVTGATLVLPDRPSSPYAGPDDTSMPEEGRRLYIAARMDHLFGETAKARREYLAAARSGSGLLSQAGEILAERIRGSP
jgi:hypothetical protein